MRKSSYTLKSSNFKVINAIRYDFNASKPIDIKILNF
jgi:hypothetical protein